MYLSDKLVFVELHKTGGSHIGRLLADVVQGQQIGKHRRIPASLLTDRFVLGSIRNPWDWYVSLWAYGCDSKGSVWHQSTRGVSLDYCLKQLPREMGLTYPNPQMLFTQLLADSRKPVHEWRSVYKDVENPQLFQRWLKLIFNHDRRYDVGEGYGFSAVSRIAGIYTYRVLKLFTSIGNQLYIPGKLNSTGELLELWHSQCVVDYVIRNESLEDDLLTALSQANIDVSESQRKAILEGKSQKTNTSVRKQTDHYYDDETIAMVADRERLVIELFNYKQII